MYFLSITDPQIWLLAGISILVVFAILVILVIILNIFSLVSKKQTTAKAKAVKEVQNSQKVWRKPAKRIRRLLQQHFISISRRSTTVRVVYLRFLLTTLPGVLN